MPEPVRPVRVDTIFHCLSPVPPPGYCNYQDVTSSLSFQIFRSCDLENESKLCIQNRKGLICGQCEEGYSVFYHSENFNCGRCPYGAIGLLIYVINELLSLLVTNNSRSENKRG